MVNKTYLIAALIIFIGVLGLFSQELFVVISGSSPSNTNTMLVPANEEIQVLTTVPTAITIDNTSLKKIPSSSINITSQKIPVNDIEKIDTENQTSNSNDISDITQYFEIMDERKYYADVNFYTIELLIKNNQPLNEIPILLGITARFYNTYGILLREDSQLVTIPVQTSQWVTFQQSSLKNDPTGEITRYEIEFFSGENWANPSPGKIDSFEHIQSRALSLPYTTLARDPDKYKGKYVVFYGKVNSVFDNADGVQTVKMSTKPVQTSYSYSSSTFIGDDILGIYYDPSNRILEDDIITIYGIFEGITNYETVTGSIRSLPFITIITFQ